MPKPAGDLVYFNGLDGSSGEYLIPPMTPEQLARLAQGESIGASDLAELKWRADRTQAHFGVKEGVDATDLGQAGWGVICTAGADPSVKDALGELLEHRRSIAGPRYREFDGPTGFRSDDTKNSFLARLGVGPGPVDPDKVPYYLLIVGDPEAIPYSFQSQLDVAYAVGRIHFDTPDEYAQYAHSVVTAETTDLGLARRATFFGSQNHGDGATELSATHLVGPLATSIVKEKADWTVETVIADDATKARLGRVLGGDQTPSLLFTASHGIGFALDDPRQRQHQGALVCQDWPGPTDAAGQPFSPDWYFAADDVPDDARLLGLVAMHFACFGAGTPHLDEFAHLRDGSRERAPIAPAGFVAGLPRRLLAHPRGGALAVIGHVERAWGSSFIWQQAGDQLTVFQSALSRLMDGQPVGYAVDFFNDRYAQIAVELSSALEDIKYGAQPDVLALSSLWTANNDARGYSVVGDPAVRLVTGAAAAPERPTAAVRVRGKHATAAPKGAAEARATAAADTSASAIPSVSAALSTPVPAVDYGFFDASGLKQIQTQLTDGLRGLVDKLTTTLAAVIDDATSLEVETYVSDQMDGVIYDGHKFTGTARLRALTRISLDGDTLAVVPQTGSRIDMDIWKVHLELVAQAQTSRTALISAAASAAAGLLGSVKGG